LVYAFLGEREVATRAEVMERFARDEDASVRSILNDLVESGLVYRTGRGQGALFRIPTRRDLGLVSDEAVDPQAVALLPAVDVDRRREAVLDIDLDPLATAATRGLLQSLYCK
jgi:hypothetical protein